MNYFVPMDRSYMPNIRGQATSGYIVINFLMVFH